MKRQGKTIIPTFTFERIENTIRDLAGEPFHPKFVAEKAGLDVHLVCTFLARRLREGLVERLQKGLYCQTTNKLRTRRKVPQALISENLWQVLLEAEKPLALSECVERTEIKVNRPISLYNSVASLVTMWCCDGYLERFGKRGEYKYKKLHNIIDRPVVNSKNYPRIYTIHPKTFEA